MTFWDAMKGIWTWVEGHITRILALSLGTVTALLTTGVIPAADVKWYMAAITVLTYWRGEATNNTYQVAKAVVATTKQVTAESPPPPSPSATAILAADQPSIAPAATPATVVFSAEQASAVADALYLKMAQAQQRARERASPLDPKNPEHPA